MATKSRKAVRIVEEADVQLSTMPVSKDEFACMVAHRLQDLRANAQVKQTTVAPHLGIGKIEMSRLERGTRPLSAYEAVAAARAYGVPVEELLNLEIEGDSDA